MKYFDIQGLKEEFFNYFTKECECKKISGASLVPDVDNSVLYTPAGMLPLIPYLIGQKEHPSGEKLVNIQGVVRTGALNRVGTDFFLTFFELFGVWKLNEYNKEEVLKNVWNFLTSKEHLEIPIDQIHITYFGGNDFDTKDESTTKIWSKLGIQEEHMWPSKKNWKGPYTDHNICGPNTRIFYDTGKDMCSPTCSPLCNCGKYVEIWDVVFFDYLMIGTHLEKSNHPCVDMGAGVERLAGLIQNANTIYDTDVLEKAVEKVLEIQKTNMDKNDPEILRKCRIVADHTRCMTFIMGDQTTTLPSNKGRSYVLRKIIRRAINNCEQLGIEATEYHILIDKIIELYSKEYPELKEKRDFILESLLQEYRIYTTNMKKNILKIERKLLNKTEITEEEINRFFDEYGVPIYKINEIVSQKKILVRRREK